MGIRITPRKEEVAAMLLALNIEPDEATKEDKDQAKQILKAAADILSRRSGWVVVSKLKSGYPILTGPYWSEGQAKKGDGAIGLGTNSVIHPTFGPGEQMGNSEEIFWPKHCRECLHRDFDHLSPDGRQRGKCALTDCDCTKYKKIE